MCYDPNLNGDFLLQLSLEFDFFTSTFMGAGRQEWEPILRTNKFTSGMDWMPISHPGPKDKF